MSIVPAPRACRNCNPGNLVIGTAWEGLKPRLYMTLAQLAETKFCVFVNDAYGFRALALTLIAYQEKHGLNTIRGIITRFAPASENPTDAYIKSVCAAIGKEPDAPLDMHDLTTLTDMCRAIAVVEAGAWLYAPGDLAAGVNMALSAKPQTTIA